jgi:HK97 family phage prohead protease
MAEATSKPHPPKDGLVRAARPGLEIRAAADGAKMPTLYGHLLRFDEPTRIDSIFEGTFIERIAPGAAKRTLKNNSGSIKILFNHGHDPHIGEKALAPPTLTEDDEGVAYEGEMFDTSYNRDLVPGLEAGQYGSSFKFRVIKETFDEEPEKSSDNPEGLPERTIEELQLYEGGPVTFPAYEGAESGVRSGSLTDRMFIEGIKRDPSRAHELDEVFIAWVGHNEERVREILNGRSGEEGAERKAIPYAKTGTDAAGDDSATGAEVPNDATDADEEPAPHELDEDSPEGTPQTADEADTEAGDDARADALPGPEVTPHSADGTRAPFSRPKPPWHQSQKKAPPWRGDN